MGKKRVTVIMVPGEADRKIRRIRTSWTTIFVLMSALVSLTIAFLIWLEWRKTVYDDTIEDLKIQIITNHQSHKTEISLKNEQIEQLQQEIILLSEQAEEVKAKILELEQLESEIEELTGVRVSDPGEKDDESPVQAAGGILHEAEPDQILHFAGDMEQDFEKLKERLNQITHRLNALIVELEYQNYVASVTPSIWPTDSKKISSRFGYRLDPFTRRTAFHSGIDIEGRTNDNIYATAAGIVTEAGSTRELGNYIIIDHSFGIRTLYAHLNEILVERRDRVTKGELIGRMGTTGRSTGTHLHYEVHKNGTPVDPAMWITD